MDGVAGDVEGTATEGVATGIEVVGTDGVLAMAQTSERRAEMM